jgi:hypothetical protein
LCIERRNIKDLGELEDDTILKGRYEKICQDIMTECKSLIDIEGWNENMVNEWLEEKYNTKNPVV